MAIGTKSCGTDYNRQLLAKTALEDSYHIYDEERKRDLPGWNEAIAPLAATCINSLGAVLQGMGDLEGATRLVSEAIVIFREAYSQQERSFRNSSLAAEASGYRPNLFRAILSYVNLLYEQERFFEAREAFEEGQKMYDKMPELSRRNVRSHYVRLLSEYAGMLGELGDAACSLDTHRAAIREAERPAEFMDRYLYKGRVRSSYQALIEHHARREDAAQAFRCLAALRDAGISALSKSSEEGMEAAGEALLEREKELGRKIHVVAAETLSGNNLLLAVIRGGQTEASCFIVPDFAQLGIRLFNNIRTCIFGEKNRPGSDGDLNAIVALGRLAWKVLPQPVRNALLPQDNTDVLISGDSYWTAFPWEALRVDQQGKEEWLGHLQTLARWSPITAKGLSQLAPQSFGNGSRVAAVICPWDALPERLLSSAQGEAAMVSATLRDHHYHLIGGDALVGSAATKTAILQAITLEPSIIHFVGHGDIQGTEEVLMVSGDTLGKPVPFGKTELLQYKKEQGIAGRLFKYSPLFIMNSCFSGTSRVFGGHREDLVAFLVEQGTAAVIASPFPVHDALGAVWGQDLYQSLTLSHNILSDAFMQCRMNMELACSQLPSRVRPLWMLWHLHGNPFSYLA